MRGKDYKIKIMQLGYKQCDVAKQIGANYIVLNMFLNDRQGLRNKYLQKLDKFISDNSKKGEAYENI